MTIYGTPPARRRGGRHRPAYRRAQPRSHDPLFGTGIRLASGFAQHDFSGVELGFWAMLRQLPALVRTAFALAWEAGRWLLPAAVTANVLAGACTALLLVATNQVLAVLLSGPPTRDRLAMAAPALGLLAAAAAANGLLSSFGNAANGWLGPKADRLAFVRLLEGAAGVELASIEDSQFHNLIEAAQRGTMAARLVVAGAVTLVQALARLLAAGGVLAALHPILLPLLVLVIVPPAWAAIRAARAQFLSMKRWTESRRQLDMLSMLLTEPEAADEVRAHGTGEFLLEHFRRLSGMAEAEEGRLATQGARGALIGQAASGLARVATYGALGGLLVSGAVELAVAGTAVLAVRTGTENLTALVTAVSGLYEQGLFVRDWQQACERATTEAMRSGSQPVPEPPRVVSTHGLTFHYPNATEPALRGVDVTVRRGEIVALVGENGSGKTTLAKLLVGLYLPTAGTVAWDGVSTTDLRRRDLFGHVGLVAQNFVRWPFMASVNVTIGRTAAVADKTSTLHRAARFGGADAVVEKLEKGWHTLLAREFWGGVEISGGQWQRIGLARAHFRNASLMVFDEPTAALDPETEIEVFDRVCALADAGHSVLLVTHRLASVRRADRIYVLAGGEVAESGTHDELFTQDGRYARMYNAQAREYRRTVEAPAETNGSPGLPSP